MTTPLGSRRVRSGTLGEPGRLHGEQVTVKISPLRERRLRRLLEEPVIKERRRSLAPLYRQLNREFFANRLPSYHVRRHVFQQPKRRTKWVAGKGYVAVIASHPDLLPCNAGLCDSDSRTIWLWEGLSSEQEREVLLHEMCHIGTPGHGPEFQLKLARLAEQGETWAEAERKVYESLCIAVSG